MKIFFDTLMSRNPELFWFGAVMLLATLVMGVLSRVTSIEVAGVNAWYKPMKFALSTALYSWTMGYIVLHLPAGWGGNAFTWGTIILLGFEVLYITLQAGRGMLSHYNMSTPLYSGLYGAMALAATAITLWTAYVAVLFFSNSFPTLPLGYLWGIRLGLVLFVIFSFEGFAMGSRLTHTVGGPDGNHGIWFLGWSLKHGDLRVAHFIGMHALQVLPLLGMFVLRKPSLVIAASILYGLLAVWVLAVALKGKPFIPNRQAHVQATQEAATAHTPNPTKAA